MKTNSIKSLVKNVARYVHTRLVAGPNVDYKSNGKLARWFGRIDGEGTGRAMKNIVLTDVSVTPALLADGADGGCTYRAVGNVSHASILPKRELFHVKFDPTDGMFTIDGMRTSRLKTLFLKDDGSVMGEFQPT